MCMAAGVLCSGMTGPYCYLCSAAYAVKVIGRAPGYNLLHCAALSSILCCSTSACTAGLFESRLPGLDDVLKPLQSNPRVEVITSDKFQQQLGSEVQCSLFNGGFGLIEATIHLKKQKAVVFSDLAFAAMNDEGMPTPVNRAIGKVSICTPRGQPQQLYNVCKCCVSSCSSSWHCSVALHSVQTGTSTSEL